MGKGGGDTTSTGTTYTSNIPEYAKPYVETMLGATQKQLFTGNDTEDGGYNITGFRPYQPYSTNASDYIAGFSPLQQKAQNTIGGMQTPGQFQTASDVTGAGIMGAAQVGQQAGSLYGLGNAAANVGNQYAQQATNPNAISAYMSPYMQNVLQGQQNEAIRQSEMQKMGNQAQAVQAGAYGGSRQALVEAERQRNLGTQLGGIQAQGLQNAFQNAQQAQQYGAGLNLQGLQAGAGMYGQGLGAQQAAIGQMMQGAGQYAGLGAQQLQAEQGIANLQNTIGAQQQSMEQQKINQSIQDYANAQQYPLMQLGTMSNMLRGLPMQAQTTQQYVAAPNGLTQAIGTAGAAASIYNATKAEGGVIKSMAQGGITSVPSYDVGGEVKGQLASMDIEELEKQANGSPSRTVREMAKELLREKQMARVPQGAAPTGPMGVDYQAPQLAGGGIIAFAKPDEDNNYSLVKEDYNLLPNRGTKVAPSFDDNPAGGILGNASTPLAKPAPMTAEKALPTISTLGDPNIAEMKREYLEQKQKANRPVAEIAAEKMAAAGPNVAAQEMRKKVMDERANADDEAKRQRWMRAASFFAKWGSTPGPVLVAGMNALNEKLPEIISDEQGYKKAKRELDKTVFDLDQADRLEKQGYTKEAIAEREKAADRGANLWHYMTNYQSAANTAATHERYAKYTADKHLEGQKLMAAASGTSKADKSLNDIQRNYLNASTNYDNVIKQIDNAKKEETYVAAKKELANTPKKMSEALAKSRAKKQAFVDAAEKDWLKRKQDALDTLELYKQQALPVFEKRGVDTKAKDKDKATETVAPPTTAASVTVGGKTYTRPAGFSDSQWEEYKKSQGVK
jgi:hypothetical protein